MLSPFVMTLILMVCSQQLELKQYDCMINVDDCVHDRMHDWSLPIEATVFLCYKKNYGDFMCQDILENKLLKYQREEKRRFDGSIFSDDWGKPR